MTRLGALVRLRVFLRSFAVQGSWNYRTLLGTGFAFALLPALRRVHDERAALHAAVDRESALFNSHPYLVGVALGAVARLEAEGESPELIERFKAALRGSLGQLGDRLVWAGWRPACVLLGLGVLLSGLPWWLAVSAFLLCYNTGHVLLRWWGLQMGFEAGRHVAERVRAAGLDRLRERIAAGGAFLLGVTLPLLVGRGVGPGEVPLWGTALAAGAAALGLRYGARARDLGVYALVLVVVMGFLLKATQ